MFLKLQVVNCNVFDVIVKIITQSTSMSWLYTHLLNMFTLFNLSEYNRACKWVTIHGETPRDWS